MASEDPELAHLERELSGEYFSKRCCFCIPSRSIIWWKKISSPADNHDTWWAKPIRAIKRIREWSELVAGPRWKTFIRRFNRNRSVNRHANFQYDPLSYAMNFDEGRGRSGDFMNDVDENSEEFDDSRFRDFSSRYASISRSAKSSTAFGKETPVFS